MKQVTIYTDGSCRGNPGPGGWAAILTYQREGKTATRELSGSEVGPTTNNRMEIQAAIQALSALKEPCQVELVTDSEYLVKVASPTAKVKANFDLVAALRQAMKPHQVTFTHIAGHSGNALNERADTLAMAATPA
jgi:ribonuclease HI